MIKPESPKDATALGQCARMLRKSRGLTLRALSERAGLGIRFLSEFERGKDTAELGKALAALKALGLKVVVSPEEVSVEHAPGAVGRSETRPPPHGKTGDSTPVTPAPAVTVRGPRPGVGGDVARLWDMLVATDDARDVLHDCSRQQHSPLPVVHARALERCFDVLGEAARRVTPQCQARFTSIPWREIITRRNNLVMNYEQVDHGGLVGAARQELPKLAKELQAALSVLHPGRNPVT